MAAIIAIVLIVIGALVVLGFAAHILFSPWLLILAVGVLAWVMLRRRSSRQ